MASEASHRGLVMPSLQGMDQGRDPRWARVWLIDRGRRLPTDYKILQKGEDANDMDNFRCRFDIAYLESFPCKPAEKHHIFSDGKFRYVESYVWDDKNYLYKWPHWKPRESKIPVLSFIWKMLRFCPPPDGRIYLNQPCDSERF